MFLPVVSEISKLLETGLDSETLAICIKLCESGVNPEALAMVVKELKREAAALKVEIYQKLKNIYPPFKTLRTYIVTCSTDIW